MNRLASLTAVALTVALAHELASITWLLWPQAENGYAPPPAVSTPAPKPAVEGAAVAEWHLFGRAGARRTSPARFTHVPETSLNLDLHGVLHSPDWALAIIAIGGGTDRIYQVGDELPGGAALAAIYPNRVILLRNGRHESLRLQRKRLQPMPADELVARRPVASGRDTLAEYRHRIMSNPAVLAEYLRITPVRDGDDLVGFRVSPGSNPALFKAAGLRPGDLVTAVGGMPLTNRRAALKALNRVRTANRVTLAVSRDGRREVIVLDFG